MIFPSSLPVSRAHYRSISFYCIDAVSRRGTITGVEKDKFKYNKKHKIQRLADIQEKINAHTGVGKYNLLALNKTTKTSQRHKNSSLQEGNVVVLLGLSGQHNVLNISKVFGYYGRWYSWLWKSVPICACAREITALKAVISWNRLRNKFTMAISGCFVLIPTYSDLFILR